VLEVVNAFVKLVPASAIQELAIDDVKELLTYYKEITSKTGNQLDWNYSEVAFPYTIKDYSENVLQLTSKDSRYNKIYVGVASEEGNEDLVQYYIQVTLPQEATHGDKGKANEFCKFLGKKLEGELHLFNGRIIYYYKRK
jgi:hypothetical protein